MTLTEVSNRKRYVCGLVLLLILLAIAGHNLYIRIKTASWNEQLLIKVFPINGDRSKVTERYIQSLQQKDIEDISLFINTEANRYRVSDKKVTSIQLGEEIDSRPPEVYRDRNVLNNVYWSIAFRVWVNWQLFLSGDRDADIAIAVLYFDPFQFSNLSHSVGLQKVMIGLVNAYTDQAYQGSINVIITHELLHTLGATDKYDPASNNPIFPIGFGCRSIRTTDNSVSSISYIEKCLDEGAFDGIYGLSKFISHQRSPLNERSLHDKRRIRRVFRGERAV